MKDKIFKIIKIILLLLVVCLIIFLTLKFLPMFKSLTTAEGRIEFKTEISDMGLLGVFSVGGLICLQMLLAFLPGEPIEILAGMCYGTIGGTILIFTSVFIMTTIIFFCVRKLGKSFIASFLGKDKIDKFENIAIFKDEKKVEMFMFIMFLIPGSPKDVFTYIAGLLPIKPLIFILISTFARFPSVISSTFAGSNLANGNYFITILAFVITSLVSLAGIYVVNKINKKVA